MSVMRWRKTLRTPLGTSWRWKSRLVSLSQEQEWDFMDTTRKRRRKKIGRSLRKARKRSTRGWFGGDEEETTNEYSEDQPEKKSSWF
jgi:hypothetical protein